MYTVQLSTSLRKINFVPLKGTTEIPGTKNILVYNVFNRIVIREIILQFTNSLYTV